MDKLHEKLERLRQYIAALGSVAVAFSAGVDSTFLLCTAHDVLGKKSAAITVRSRVFPDRESKEASDFCQNRGINHIVINSDELSINEFRKNPPNRCYICKLDIFSRIKSAAESNGLKYVAEGSNIDDVGDYRPGMQAIAELDIKSPLRDIGLTKNDIRLLSKEIGLSTWNKPSFACLATRFVYGEEITEQKLDMVDKAEQYLYELGFSQFRVRIHGTMARIELIPDEFEKMFKNSLYEKINLYLRSLGFVYVALDLGGYKMGSMNRELKF